MDMNAINLDKLLPLEMVDANAYHRLYLYGISLFKNDSSVKRSKLYNPLIIFIVFLFVVLKNIYLLIQNNTNPSKEYNIYFGDLGAFLGIRYQFHLIMI